MRRFMITLLCLLAAACPPLALCAQNAQVVVEGNNTSKVLLEDLHIDLRLIGNRNLVTWTMVFRNTTPQMLEGLFQFPMEENTSVTSFAVDIGAKLRYAVPIPKDIPMRPWPPAKLESGSGQLFRRSLGSIPASGTRTVVVGYELPLVLKGSKLECVLPMAQTKELTKMSISVSSYLDARPEITGMNVPLNFQREGLVWTAKAEQAGSASSKPLVIRVAPPKAATVFMQEKGDKHFALIQTPARVASHQRALPDNITILWDASLSGIRRNRAAELELLDGYLKRVANATVNLIVFRNTTEPMVTFPIRSGNWQLLRDAIEGLKYDGGTQLGKLDLRNVPGREFLLFSDGISDFGARELISGRQPVYCITSTRMADLQTLDHIAAKSGGRVIDLTKTLMHVAMDQLLHFQFQLIGIKKNSDVDEVYPNVSIVAANAPCLSAVFTADTGRLILQYGYSNIVTEEEEVVFNAHAKPVSDIDLSRIWAQQKMESLDADFNQHHKTIESIGRHYALASRNTALVVLKDAADYARFGIVAPANMKEDYGEALRVQKEEREARLQGRIASAERNMAQLNEWWGHTYTGTRKSDSSTKLAPKTQLAIQHIGINKGIETDPMGTSVLMAGVTDPEVKGSFYRFIDEGDPLFGIGEGRREWRKQRALQADLDSIAVIAGRTDSTLMDSLFSHSMDEQDSIFIGLRQARLQSPTFYFQVAEQFMMSGRKEVGLRILSNLAELELEDYEVFKALGYKLREAGDAVGAQEAFRKALSLQPNNLQARRDYGLALAELGLYKAAVDTLFAALTAGIRNEDSTNMNEVLLCDINGILTQHPEAQIAALPRRLVQRTPVDMRVILSWNTPNTDIDLVVTEPNGEQCYYGHDTTASGGRYFADMRSGFGPEQYLIKNVVAGKYRIQAVRSSVSSATTGKPITIMAEIYTGWGKPEQRRYISVVHLKPNDPARVLLGEFDFGMKL